MSSYGSQRSDFMHPHYAAAAPPYPTTPGTSPKPGQQLPFYPPQPRYLQPRTHFQAGSLRMPSAPRDRRSSSHSSIHRPSPHLPPPAGQPVVAQDYAALSMPPSYANALPHAPPIYGQNQPVYTRSVSHTSYHTPHDHHTYADGENQYENDGGKDNDIFGVLDEEIERQYERRYAKEKAMERRPTLGESVLSIVGKVGRVLGSERR